MGAGTDPGRLGAGRLVVTCADRPGIVAAVTSFLFTRGANITHADQHSSDPVGGRFFLRVVLHLDGLERRLDELREGSRPRWLNGSG